MASLHGRIAIGILIMQDLAAVIFLAVSTGQWPSPWALSVLLLIPLRPVLHLLLVRQRPVHWLDGRFQPQKPLMRVLQRLPIHRRRKQGLPPPMRQVQMQGQPSGPRIR